MNKVTVELNIPDVRANEVFEAGMYDALKELVK